MTLPERRSPRLDRQKRPDDSPVFRGTIIKNTFTCTSRLQFEAQLELDGDTHYSYDATRLTFFPLSQLDSLELVIFDYLTTNN